MSTMLSTIPGYCHAGLGLASNWVMSAWPRPELNPNSNSARSQADKSIPHAMAYCVISVLVLAKEQKSWKNLSSFVLLEKPLGSPLLADKDDDDDGLLWQRQWRWLMVLTTSVHSTPSAPFFFFFFSLGLFFFFFFFSLVWGLGRIFC